jgi:hypothetical protein
MTSKSRYVNMVPRLHAALVLSPSPLGSSRSHLNRLVVAALLASLLAGCLSRVVLVGEDGGPVGTDGGMKNSSDWVWAAKTFLGLAPILPLEADGIEGLKRAGAAKGIQVVTGPWKAVSDQFGENGPLPVLLTRQSGPPLVLIDVFAWKGEMLYLVATPQEGALVFPEKEFKSAPWVRAAWIEPGQRAPYELPVGPARLSLARPWHSFGPVKPYTTVRTEFRLENPTDVSVWIDRINTSCGCTTVIDPGTKTIPPRSSITLPISLRTDSRRVIAQHVWITVSPAIDGPVQGLQLLTLELYGWQPEAMEVSPARLDFGPVYRSQDAETVVRLSESTDDRFELRSIDFAGLPMSKQVRTENRSNGLRTYLVTLHLDARGLDPGDRTTMIAFETSSTFRPKVEMPVHFTVAHEVKARPALVEFTADCSDGTAPPVEINLRHRDEKSLSISGIEAPAGISVAIEKSGVVAVMKVSTAGRGENKTGVIKLRASWDGGEELLEIPYYCFANP